MDSPTIAGIREVVCCSGLDRGRGALGLPRVDSPIRRRRCSRRRRPAIWREHLMYPNLSSCPLFSSKSASVRAATARRIAYAIAGRGPPLLWTRHFLRHLEFDWYSPVWRSWRSRGVDNWGDLENHVLSEAANERRCVFAARCSQRADVSSSARETKVRRYAPRSRRASGRSSSRAETTARIRAGAGPLQRGVGVCGARRVRRSDASAGRHRGHNPASYSTRTSATPTNRYCVRRRKYSAQWKPAQAKSSLNLDARECKWRH